MRGIRLKSSLDPMQITDRLRYQPEIMELQLFEEDLVSQQNIINTARFLKNKGVKVYLHHPMRYKGEFLDILNLQVREYYDWSCEQLALICEKEDIYCVVHPHYASSECSDFANKLLRRKVRNRIEYLLSQCGHRFLWENTIEGIFSSENPYLFEEIVAPLDLPLCMDVSHAFIAVKGNNSRLRGFLRLMQNYTAYFHIVDSMGISHDSLPLGEGRINWRMVVPFLNMKDYVFEVGLVDYNDASPMVASAAYLEKIKAQIKGDPCKSSNFMPKKLYKLEIE